MQCEQNRHISFNDFGWPHPEAGWKATPEALAAAGFYYDPIPSRAKDSEPSDRVCCYLCNVVLSNWKSHMDPMERHRQEYIECPIVSSRRRDCRLTSSEIKTARRQTFGKWWPHKTTSKDGTKFYPTAFKLAEAGFVFTPTNELKDLVSCQICSLAMHSFKASDDPMEVHRVCSESCPFVLELLENDILKKSIDSATSQQTEKTRAAIIKDQRILRLNELFKSQATVQTKVSKSVTKADSQCNTPMILTQDLDHSLIAPQSPLNNGSAGLTPLAVKARNGLISPGSRQQPLKKRRIYGEGVQSPPLNIQSSRGSPILTNGDKQQKKPKLDHKNGIVGLGQFKEMLSQFLTIGEAFKLELETSDILNQFGAQVTADAQRTISSLKQSNQRLLDEVARLNNARRQEEFRALSSKTTALDSSDAASEIASDLDSVTFLRGEEISKQTDLAMKLKQKQLELERLQTSIRYVKEESESWKTSWETLKKENDRLRGQPSSVVPLSHRHLIAGLSANARRAWYEGECWLFDCRVGLRETPISHSLDLHSQIFLSFADIPWPVAPSTPLTNEITSPMIASFLLNDLTGTKATTFIQSLIQRFEDDQIKKWIKYVGERERLRVFERASEVVNVLRSFFHLPNGN